MIPKFQDFPFPVYLFNNHLDDVMPNIVGIFYNLEVVHYVETCLWFKLCCHKFSFSTGNLSLWWKSDLSYETPMLEKQSDIVSVMDLIPDLSNNILRK